MEIGLRSAIGATKRCVVWMVLRDSVAAMTIGLSLGVLVAFAASRLAESFVDGLSRPGVTTVVVALLAWVAMTAVSAAVPAYRAARTDPFRALRFEYAAVKETSGIRPDPPSPEE
jgi:putative ABC transport system permease protein